MSHKGDKPAEPRRRKPTKRPPQRLDGKKLILLERLHRGFVALHNKRAQLIQESLLYLRDKLHKLDERMVNSMKARLFEHENRGAQDRMIRDIAVKKVLGDWEKNASLCYPALPDGVSLRVLDGQGTLVIDVMKMRSSKDINNRILPAIWKTWRKGLQKFTHGASYREKLLESIRRLRRAGGPLGEIMDTLDETTEKLAEKKQWASILRFYTAMLPLPGYHSKDDVIAAIKRGDNPLSRRALSEKLRVRAGRHRPDSHSAGQKRKPSRWRT